ncbi:MAG: methyltransferase domain-containing protein [Candidatus Sulfotelmatobacter sp.]|jgi:SAM-dependent methyltransferase
MLETKEPLLPPRTSSKTAPLLFLASAAALYFEFVIIRYLASEIRVFAYLKNMSLIASFFGIGLGMILGTSQPKLRRTMPVLAALLFVLVANASVLQLTHIPMPTIDYWQFSFETIPISALTLVYVFVVLYFLALVIGIFVVLGGFVGEYLSKLPRLRAYGINLAGSLAGIVIFTLLALAHTPPWVWLLIGFLLLLPFFIRDGRSLAIFALVVVGVAVSQPRAIWSPYYRISLQTIPAPPGEKPRGYTLSVDYDYFQNALNLSPDFVRENPTAEPNRSALRHYELPYRLLSASPLSVLVVGAGTGNDVAAALRHGAEHVDAVEIDPLILQIGRRIHPEQPYSSSRVTVYNDDARAFFKKATQSYDLIVFGYLDSHTMSSAFSSVRLENNVYTVQSFQEARRLLRPGGTMVLAFGSGDSFVSKRLYRMLSAAFGVAPLAYWTFYDLPGVILVEGIADPPMLAGFPEVGDKLRSDSRSVVLATDQWPFLFLTKRTIPIAMLLALLSFIAFAAVLCRRTLRMRNVANPALLHMFFLGAGFLLLETKGVTELSLLFGATWITNTVVISSFIAMAMAANAAITFYSVYYRLAFILLFLSLMLAGFFPYAWLAGLPLPQKVLFAGTLTALPVFFSGLIFSRSFQLGAQPSQALGMNLLGAVIGGVLENLVMIGGTTVLGWLAIGLYALAALSLIADQESGSQPENAPLASVGTA